MNSIVESKFSQRTSAFILVLLWSVVSSFSSPSNDKAGERFLLEGNTPVHSLPTAAGWSKSQSHWQSLGPGCLSASQIIVDPQRPSVVYALTGRVYKSSDGGANWQLAEVGLPAQPESGHALAIDPQRPSVLYLGSSSGIIYRTTDGAATWTKMPPGPSGVNIIVVSPTDSLTLYAGQAIQGASKSSDGGITWTSLGIAINIRTIAFDPKNSAVIYIGGIPISYEFDGGGLWKSVDAGANWTAADAGLFTGTYQCVSSIAVDPKSSSIVYAGTYQGLYKSTDGGLSWICLYQKPGQEKKIVIDPQESNILYLVVVNMGYVSPPSPLLLKSCDGGRSWAIIMKGLENATAFYDIALSGQEPNVLWIATEPLGISKTYDGGTTWYPSSAGFPSSMPVTSLGLPPLAAAHVYVGTAEGFPPSGVFRSLTGGTSWQAKNDGLNLYSLPRSHRLLMFISGDPSSPAKLYAYVEEWWFRDVGGTFLFQSLDGGDHWSGLSSNGAYKYGLVVDPKNPSVLYAPSSRGVAKSSDGGLTWTDLNVPQASVLVIHSQTPALLFAGTKNSGVFVSYDAGANWTAVNSGLADLNILALALAEDSPAVLYAGTASGMFQSSDKGAHWTAINNGLSNLVVKAIAVDSRHPSTLYAGTDGGGVFRSVDGGANWTAFNAGLDDLTVNCLAVDPSDSNRVYAGTNSGLFSTYGPPSISLSRNRMTFGVIAGGPGPRPQIVEIKNQGSAALQWTATSTASWIQLQPGAGSGNGLLQVSVIPAAFGAGKYTGLIRVFDPAADNSPQLIDIELNVYAQGTTGPPFGYFDAPLDGTTGINGSIPVTGWALDDIETTAVKIYRDPVGTEPAGSRVYIGDAIFVEGARPDVELAFPSYPLISRAGWGYMMLTNFLPNGGNGTFTIYAYATDREGHEVRLGSKTITCDNANAVKPFGAIDLPAQGETISGAAYINGGWALTPPPNAIPTDGSTLMLWVDGLPIGRPSYNHFRGDIAALFPGYANSNGAVGVFTLDTTSIANGVHTIEWSVRDNANNEDGIGSRYFSILNIGIPALSSAAPLRGSLTALSELAGFKSVYLQPIYSRKGFDRSQPPDRVLPTSTSVIPSLSEGSLLIIRELERVEVLLDDKAWSADAERRTAEQAGLPLALITASTGPSGSRWEGYLIVGEELRPLPIGSTLDTVAGIFFWQPGPGFLGDYDFIFVERVQNTKKAVKIRIGMKLEREAAI